MARTGMLYFSYPYPSILKPFIHQRSVYVRRSNPTYNFSIHPDRWLGISRLFVNFFIVSVSWIGHDHFFCVLPYFSCAILYSYSSLRSIVSTVFIQKWSNQITNVTPQSGVLLEKPVETRRVKTSPIFYGTWITITVFTKTHQQILFRDRSIQDRNIPPSVWRFNLLFKLVSILHVSYKNSVCISPVSCAFYVPCAAYPVWFDHLGDFRWIL